MVEQNNCLNRKPLSKGDTVQIQKLEKLLSTEKSLPRLVSSDGEELVIPQPIFEVLCRTVEAMARGEEILISPIDQSLSIQEAADLLNVPHDYLVKLLDAGEIPYETIGSQRKIIYRNVLAYKVTKKKQQREVLSELTSFLQEEGFYDD